MARTNSFSSCSSSSSASSSPSSTLLTTTAATDPVALGAPLQRLSDALAAVKKPGAFFASGSVTTVSPDLFVPGAGAIPLPVTGKTAKMLTVQAQQAPFGRGEKTLVDTCVRKTWELPPDQFKLRNASWHGDVITPMAHECARQMGVASPTRVEAKLYKLLVYEKGGKFERHRDSEKETGMFGTLVVVLPIRSMEVTCWYPPGESATHSEPHTWKTSGYNSKTAIPYAAFYADCEHAVEPVTSGYRVCLTYNLILPQTRAKMSDVANVELQVPELTEALHSFFTTPTIGKDQSTFHYYVSLDGKDPKKLSPPSAFTYVLDHKYTDESLSLAQLKNKDLAVAQRLARVCANSKLKPFEERYKLYLCHVEYRLAYDPEYDYEEEDEKERTLMLNGPWRCLDGGGSTTAPLGDRFINLYREMAPIGRFDRVKFDGHETEYTGNEGMRRENWYKTAALVMLPLREEHKMMIERGPDTFTTAMIHPIDSVEVSEEKQYLARLAFTNRAHDWVNTSYTVKYCAQTVVAMNDAELLVSLICSMRAFQFDEKKVLVDALLQLGWEACFPKLLEAMKKRAFDFSLRSRMNLIRSLGVVGEDAKTPLLPGADVGKLAVELFDPDNRPKRYSVERLMSEGFVKKEKLPSEVDPELFTQFLQSLYRCSPKDVPKLVLLEGLSVPDLAAPAFVAFATGLEKKNTPVEPVIVEAATKLKEHITANLPNPESWVIGESLEIPHTHCWMCDDCSSIQDFYASETEQELRVRVVGSRRDHIVALVKKHLSDVMTWAVDRTGRPHALVITKKPVNVERRRVADAAIKQLERVISPRRR